MNGIVAPNQSIMAKVISNLEIVGRWGAMTFYLQQGENLVKKSREPNRKAVITLQPLYLHSCLKEIQCLSEQWMRPLRALTQTSWPRGLRSRVARLLWHWVWIETSFTQVHLRMIHGMRLPRGKAALEEFSWSAYPAVDNVFRQAVFLNKTTWETWLDWQLLDRGLTKAGLGRPTHIRVIYAEPNPEDGMVLMYGFPRQALIPDKPDEPILLTPEPYTLTGGYLIAFLEYTFEKPAPEKPWADETRYPGGIVMIGYHLP